jgi:uncharacterized membrane protein
VAILVVDVPIHGVLEEVIGDYWTVVGVAVLAVVEL